ncbi:nitroreductase [Polaribacter sp. Hel1_33_49]|uniref:nitroreductase n=1 Tax=Polaribacter sp. Hel1_33_49 TaxID=1336803 RepID=UPI00052CD518|nr:nitroreductase [Polaribacter sp. Hel1_33_49]KGL60505.1 nitroreductase family protein [Polaribacter sp. Hel1_33_49]
MTFEETNKNRRSIRDFKNTPVSDEIINQVLKEALEAPSSSNTQPFKVVVAKGDILKKIGEDLTFKYNTGQKLRKLNIFSKIYTAHKYKLNVNNVYKTIQGKYPEIFQERRVKTGFGLYKVLGIKREDKKARAASLARNFTFFDAPVGIWIFVDPKMGYTSLVDAGLFMQNLMLSATSKGLGTCAQGALNLWREPVDKHFNVPKGYELVCGLSFGYPSDHIVNSYRPEKIGLEELLVSKRK